MSRRSLFVQLFLVFFAVAFAITVSIYFSFKWLAAEKYEESFYKNILTYTNLVATRIRFDPLARAKIESSANIKVYSNPSLMRRLVREKLLVFVEITKHISLTQPAEKIYVKYDDGFDTFILEIQDPQYRPGRQDAIIVALLLSGLILIAGYFYIRKMFRPLSYIQEYAAEFGSGDLSRRIPQYKGEQLRGLTKSLNTMADQIESMLNSKRDMLLAIGHEIKTPLTKMRMRLELIDEDTTQLEHDIVEIDSILARILESERQKSHKELIKDELNLSDLFMDYSDVEVNCAVQIKIYADQNKLKLAIDNLINNARKYAPGEKILVSLSQHENFAHIEVRDFGPGVDDKKISLLTDAFYRPDSSRNRSTGGVGLGLYLVKQMVLAHNGLIELENARPGLRVTLKLPVE